ncbi:MAG: hypothetical protein IIA59_06355 [Candidatus Marinimicrobia bacterium]|nr:hypothetical protein [Candidatus Neomarinimicrobiota bacterium]
MCSVRCGISVSISGGSAISIRPPSSP